MWLLLSFIVALVGSLSIGILMDMRLSGVALAAAFAFGTGGLGSRISWMAALRRARRVLHEKSK